MSIKNFLFYITIVLCVGVFVENCAFPRQFKKRKRIETWAHKGDVKTPRAILDEIPNAPIISAQNEVENFDNVADNSPRRLGNRKKKRLRSQANPTKENGDEGNRTQGEADRGPRESTGSDSAQKLFEQVPSDGNNNTTSNKNNNSKSTADNDIDKTIEFYFENTDLQNVVAQIEQLYNVTFVSDDIVTPLASGGKALKGNKLSFKTHKPLTKKEGWNLFITFLDIAGFAIVPDADPRIFRITALAKAQRSSLPSFIGVDPETLPDSDQIIRYVYFIENISPESLKGIVDQMLSTSAGPSFALRELKALVLTDKSYNIKTLMKIVKELDQVSMPQSMSVLKLTRADADDVAKLYKDIAKIDDANVMSRLFPARKQPTSLYFPENVRVIPEKRSNSLILLGTRDSIEKIENFVMKFIDVEPDKPYSPLHTYQLQYAEAGTVANIMNELTKFGSGTSAGKVGGVRGGDKYFKSMLFIAEPSTNRLIIRGEYEDYLKAVEVIKKLDEPQSQVAIEILICTVELNKAKEIGGQLRNKYNGASSGPLGANVSFQSGAVGPIQVKGDSGGEKTPGCERLLGNLLDLVKQLSAGNTVVSFGCDAFGVWGILRALETVTDSEVISNPFLLTTNKTKAEVAVGEVRRLITGQIVGQEPINTFGDEPAQLKVAIRPQINSDGMIVLDIDVDIKQFTSDTQRTTRKIQTKTTVADNEVIALGGLIRNRVEDSTRKTPLFGNVPLLGWLFKNRRKAEDKANLLILVSTKIIKPGAEEELAQFTNKHIDDYYGILGQMHDRGQKKDPLTRLFFKESKQDVARRVEDLLFKNTAQKRKRKKRIWGKKRRPTDEQTEQMVAEHKSETSQHHKKQTSEHKQILAKERSRKQASVGDLGNDDGGGTTS